MKKRIHILILFVVFLSVSLVAQETQKGAYIPEDKEMDANWTASLLSKGKAKIYEGDELDYVAMPCGGIGAGQVEITGNGKLCFRESIYNQMQQPNGGLGYANGAQYLNPQQSETKVENNFAIILEEKGTAPVSYDLSGDDFDAMRFKGEYPLAQLEYRKSKTTLPVQIKSEVFSPFIPLNLRNSANPVTVVKYSITNTSAAPIEVGLVGWLKNIELPVESKVRQVNTLNRTKNSTAISFEMEPIMASDSIQNHPNYGGFSLTVLDKKAMYAIASTSSDEYIESLLNEATKIEKAKQTHSTIVPVGGAVSSSFKLAPNKTKEVTFLITWYFPNLEGNAYDTKGKVGHIYNNWFSNSLDVADYVVTNFNQLYSDTKLFRTTYNHNSLPYWLANRITMPLSTLASGNVAIWKNSRMYAYEGVGFCSGTCGHVYNFVTAISKFFPELERSVRLMQDLKEGVGYSTSGRINFRGHEGEDPNAKHSYASDAQSGYVLKIYREHLMTSNNQFLDSIWEKVKRVIGYHIYMDGAAIGLEPNGVLEGLQTFWDPMWYGPNPYNNTLYLASLRAAEEMARVQKEFDLATRYHSIFEKGQAFMNEQMWNGEYYVHLYPSGLKKHRMKNGFATLEEKKIDAIGYIDAFNSGEPSYYKSEACDANQLFGQNWAHQLGLGYLLSEAKCKTVVQNIFKYNWTPDISTVYDVRKPKNRILADKEEGAMINGSWPKNAARSFENKHDKFNIWTGLEYEAACDMINEGFLNEGLTVIKAIDDRYSGAHRNPWNEIEGSDHYSRAMHSWNVLLSLSGFTYNGPMGKIGFAPHMTPEDFSAYFSSSEGWGNYDQKQQNNQQISHIKMAWGTLKLNDISLELPPDTKVKQIKLYLDAKELRAEFSQQKNSMLLQLTSEVNIEKNQELTIHCYW